MFFLETQMTICLQKFLKFIVMNTEIWKAVNGYEGWYEVSNFGNVRSVDRVIINSDGVKRLWKGKILKPIKDRYGYLVLNLYKNSKIKKITVHRLVAQAFILNSDNMPEVNHKDEDKTNNHVGNLEWCTRLYNLTYGTRIQRGAEKRLNSPKFSKSVLQLDISTGRVIAEYPSAREAARKLNIYQGNISACCRGICKTYKGFKWKYKE